MSTIVETVVAVVAVVTGTPAGDGPMAPALDVHQDPALDMTVPASNAMALEDQLMASTTSAFVASNIEEAQAIADQGAVTDAVAAVSPEHEAALVALEEQGVIESLPMLEIDSPAVGEVARLVEEVINQDQHSEHSTDEIVAEVVAVVVRAETTEGSAA